VPRDARRNPGGPLAMPDTRLDQEFCARGFIRAAQYLANMLPSADVLAESRELVRATFLPDLVCVCRPAPDGERCPECVLGGGEIAMLRRAIRQVVETGFMAMEDLGGPSRMTCVVLPVTVRGRTETAMVIGYRSAPALPPHALEALLGVVGLVGAALARQQADRELVLLAEARAARAVAEVTERRARLLSEASKTLFASFDAEGTLASVARLVVPQLGDWCAVELRDPDRPGTARQVTFVHADPNGGDVRELRGAPGAAPPPAAPKVMTSGQPELHPEVPDAFLAEWARDARQLDAARSLGLASAIVVPIVGRGALFGAIAIGAGPRRRYGSEDLALAEEIGLRAGTAIENAGLYLQAQQAIGVRDQFLAIASHELKTPLTALALVIETAERALERMPAPPERMRSKIGVLSRQGQRLTQLVGNLLDVSRIQAGRLHVSLEPVDLGAVVREVIERHEQEASRAGCTVAFDAAEPITGAWDQSRVDQVVSNLLSNAIKYGAGKPVSLAAELCGGIARLTVIDQGMGVAPDDQERIFQRFERAVGNVGKGGIEGMGLGLWITREIVTRLGGSIRVQSELGAGARFTVELPIRPEQPSAPP